MNQAFNEKNLVWLDDRIREAEAKVAANKVQLATLDKEGLNTGEVCRRLALNTEYLQLLNVRRAAAVKKLRLLKG